MTALDAWLDRTTAHAPDVLGARVRNLASDEAARRDVEAPFAETLAAAACGVLDAVAAHEGSRTVALDLLAADALVTLALLAQAEAAPEALGAFASALLEGYCEAP